MGAMITVLAALALVHSLLANRFERLDITAPLLSLVAGLVLFSITGLGAIDHEAVHVITEVTLVVVLFHDASTVDLRRLRRDKGMPIRLLAIGFPLALLVTFGVTWVLLPAVGFAGALLIAGAVTPTDAGLGAATVLNPVVPLRVRRALNVESGLNDGLATPIVLVALTFLAEEEHHERLGLPAQLVLPILVATGLAVIVAYGAGKLLDLSHAHDWSVPRDREIAALVLPLLLFGLATVVGANPFIAAFVGGLVFGAASETVKADHGTTDLLEVAADLLGLVVWFLAGDLLLQAFDTGFDWQWIVLAVLVLTVLRMVPVWLSLLGTGFRPPTVLFLGWFGPRGLATIVFGLLALEELGSQDPIMRDVAGVLALVVLLSVVAHGFSAAPLSKRYGAWATAHPDAPVHDGE